MKILKLILAILVCELAGIIGSVFTVNAIPNWYNSLEKPFLSPPNWIFGPVWTTLYLMMGISLFLVWKNKTKTALTLFFVQLVLNSVWSIIFFGLQSPGIAFGELLILWVFILLTIISFYKISKPAAFLLIPYILWVSFAGYLNFAIWQGNISRPVACTMEARLCPDGSAVGRVGPNCEFAPCPED
ncbi:MAG: TspO/MBR family protein [Patescibacteria group bacterium]